MPETTLFRCKKCNTPEMVFDSVKALRVHQWATHREAYETTIIAARKRLKKMATKRGRGGDYGPEWRRKISEGRQRGIAARKAAAGVSVPTVKMLKQKVHAAMNGDLPLSEFIDELQEQRKLLDDFISLAEGFMAQRIDKKGF